MGTETIRVGTSRMFDMFQHQTLNKRFVYVFLEGVIITLFPQNKFAELFQRLHSRSERVAIHLAKMKEDSESAESSTRRRRRWLWEVPHQAEVIVRGTSPGGGDCEGGGGTSPDSGGQSDCEGYLSDMDVIQKLICDCPPLSKNYCNIIQTSEISNVKPVVRGCLWGGGVGCYHQWSSCIGPDKFERGVWLCSHAKS